MKNDKIKFWYLKLFLIKENKLGFLYIKKIENFWIIESYWVKKRLRIISKI